jgi:hypothetical protein
MTLALSVPAISLLLCTAACGLTVTKDRPTYDELDSADQQAVDIILGELKALNAELVGRGETTIENILERDRIHVSFDGLIFWGNLGDEVVHISSWQHLDDGQRERIAGWFKEPTLDVAKQRYETFFYRAMAVAAGTKQYMYNVLGVEWVYSNRSVFNVERDSIREALSYFEAVGRRSETWSFLSQSCQPIREQFDATYDATFGKQYLFDHFSELVDPADPTGYIYYTCRWIEDGIENAVDFAGELDWIKGMPERKL